MPTSWLSPRPTVRHSFSRCLWMEIRYRWWRQQPLPLQPAKLISEQVSQIKYCRRKFQFFSCTRFTFLNLGAVRWDTAAYSLWIMRSIEQSIGSRLSATCNFKVSEYRGFAFDRIEDSHLATTSCRWSLVGRGTMMTRVKLGYVYNASQFNSGHRGNDVAGRM